MFDLDRYPAFPFPKSMLGSGEYFLLDVVGDSMINIGILDGDTLDL